MIGFNPIEQEEYNIRDWLNNDLDNIVIYTENDVAYCLKKSYFIQANINDIYVECHFVKNALMYAKSYKSKELRNLWLYIGLKYLVDNNSFTELLNTGNIFKISKIHTDNLYILKESLMLSNIKLGYKLGKIRGLKYKDQDAYFDDIAIKALYNYSYQWDGIINRYLLYGDKEFDSEWFEQNLDRFGATKDDAIEAVKEKINLIDKCFLYNAPRFERRMSLFRGMTVEYVNKMKIGNSIVISNYISTSTKPTIPLGFIDEFKNCCMYEFVVDPSIPYINMVSSTRYLEENEILLPRGLIATCIAKGYVDKFTDELFYKEKIKPNKYYYVPIYKMSVTLKDDDQFKISNNCKKYKEVSVESLASLPKSKSLSKPKSKSFSKTKSKSLSKTKSKSKSLSKPKSNLLSKHIKRCPKGSRRNKKTGNCDKTVKESSKKVAVKQKRCPNGSRRNKKTGNCDKTI